MSATVSGVDNTGKQDMNRAYHVFLLFNGIIFGHAGSLLPPALFSSCGEWGPLSSCGARASHWDGFSCCRAQALEHWAFGCCSKRASVVVPGKLSSVPFKEQLSQKASSRLSLASHWQSWQGRRQLS